MLIRDNIQIKKIMALSCIFESYMSKPMPTLRHNKAKFTVPNASKSSANKDGYNQLNNTSVLKQRKKLRRKSLIRIPSLYEQCLPSTKPMSESVQPTSNHVSYGGQFEISPDDQPMHAVRALEDTCSSPAIPPGFRCWEQVNTSSDSEYPLNFKIVSYNVLAQCLLECHPHLYRDCSPENLKWEGRAPLLFNEIMTLEPDIICLQEVQGSYLLLPPYSTLKSLGYNCVYKQKTGNRRDGCAIYYKKNLFILQDFIHVEFYQPDLPVLNRDNIGLIVKLSPIGRGPSIVVATTHLLFNPRRTDVRLAQMQVFLAEIDRFAYYTNDKGSGHLPIIMTGDFNSQPESAVIRLLDRGLISGFENQDASNWEKIGVMNNCQHLSVFLNRRDGRHTDFAKTKLFNTEYKSQAGSSSSCLQDMTRFSEYFTRHQIGYNLRLASVYDKYKPDGSFEASTFQDRWVTVDYMYYSCQKVRLLSRLRLPAAHECEVLRPLPNEKCPSDHLVLAAAFEVHPHLCTPPPGHSNSTARSMEPCGPVDQC